MSSSNSNHAIGTSLEPLLDGEFLEPLLDGEFTTPPDMDSLLHNYVSQGSYKALGISPTLTAGLVSYFVKNGILF